MSGLKFYIVEHPKEKKHKCTVALLKGREDLTFVIAEETETMAWGDAILLDPSVDRVLGPRDAGKALILVDASALGRKVVRKITVSRRRLPPFETAYPRTSKLFRDPPGGLASAEALFVAALVMGIKDATLLDGYRWKDEFLEANREMIRDLLSSGPA